MSTEQYCIGYEAGYQDGWNAAQQPAPQPLTDEQKDAARYRWLRDGCNEKGSRASHIAANFYGMEWDAAIDDAIRRAHGIGEQP